MYSANILPHDAAYYTLHKASIVDGIMSLQAGGSAEYNITEDVLSLMPSSFRISIIPNKDIDFYEPSLNIYIRAVLADGTEVATTLTPTVNATKVYTQDIDMSAGEYTSLTFTAYAETAVNLHLWELCPESSDSSLEIEIDGVKQSLPKLLYDYNIIPLVVQQFETTIGLITFNLKYATDLQGAVHISYTADSDCVLTLRIKDTGVTELYTPILYDIRKGHGTISLPHAYIKRLTGIHSTYVTAQVSVGTLTIDTRGLLYTIDGGYLADRELDAGMDVHDITVCNTQGDTAPEELWVIGISANECIVKTRNYSEDPEVGFTPVFTLGAAKKAAIEFNGSYYLNRTKGNERYTLVTEYLPYVFWIDLRDRLMCQHGTDEETRFVVDTHVSDVSVCRGYSSTLMPEQDQGLVVLYVKNGVAKYINYCYDEESDTEYSWQGPYTVPIDESVKSVSVSRLNDYRLSFVLTTATSNWWYITERTYVTQTMEPATISVGYATVPRIAVFPKQSTYTFEATATIDNTKSNITLTFNHDVRQLYNDETFLPEEFSGVSVSSIEVVDERHIMLHLRTPLINSATISYSTGGIIKFVIEPVSNMAVPVTSFSVMLDMLPIVVDNVRDTIAVVYSTTGSLAMRPISALDNSVHETLSVTYAMSASLAQHAISYKSHSCADTMQLNYGVSASITLTQVGTHPI